MCPLRPCYTCKITRCKLFDEPLLEKDVINYDNFASVRDTGETIHTQQ